MQFIFIFQLMDIVKYLRREKEILTTKVQFKCNHQLYSSVKARQFCLVRNLFSQFKSVQLCDCNLIVFVDGSDAIRIDENQIST